MELLIKVGFVEGFWAGLLCCPTRPVFASGFCEMWRWECWFGGGGNAGSGEAGRYRGGPWCFRKPGRRRQETSQIGPFKIGPGPQPADHLQKFVEGMRADPHWSR